MTVRIDELASPPEVGRYYLVPTVLYPWRGVEREWPVFLPRHEDADHLRFPLWHYHVDPRFVGARDWRLAADNIYGSAGASFQASPLTYRPHGEPLPHPDPVWSRRKCIRLMPDYAHGNADLIQGLRATYAGQRCRMGKAGFICPHKGIALGSVPAIDGVITCPGHGLRICAASGEVLPA